MTSSQTELLSLLPDLLSPCVKDPTPPSLQKHKVMIFQLRHMWLSQPLYTQLKWCHDWIIYLAKLQAHSGVLSSSWFKKIESFNISLSLTRMMVTKSRSTNPWDLSDRLTGTFGLGPQWWPRGSGAALQRSGQQDADLVLGVGIQVADFVRGLVDGLKVVHGARHSAVFHLSFNNRAIPVDAVGVQLNPKVGGTNSS